MNNGDINDRNVAKMIKNDAGANKRIGYWKFIAILANILYFCIKKRLGKYETVAKAHKIPANNKKVQKLFFLVLFVLFSKHKTNSPIAMQVTICSPIVASASAKFRRIKFVIKKCLIKRKSQILKEWMK